jgi:endogenous inhibitor of DNA gyrase (YacG/DUF329 family)
MFKCEICGKESKGFRGFRGITAHICQIHKNEITLEEYYLKFIGEKGKCPECGKDTAFRNLSYGYSKFCSHKCSANSIETQNKMKETYMKKTGYGNPSQNPESREKRKQAYFEKTGYEYPTQDPKNIEKKKQTYFEKTGYEYPMQDPKNKEKRKQTCLENNNGKHYSKLTFSQVQEKYPNLVEIEKLKEGPNGEILAHCKNSSCKNSEENGGYFEVTAYQINMRNKGINGSDTDYFYCSEECKHSCPLYGRSANQLHNLINENPEIPYTAAEYSTWKEEVYHRQRIENNTDINFCEKCQVTENLQVHHIYPIKLYPEYALDPDNGIVFCEDCHYKYGHEKGTECSTGNLASKICK